MRKLIRCWICQKQIGHYDNIGLAICPTCVDGHYLEFRAEPKKPYPEVEK